MDDRDELLEDIERALANVTGNEFDMDATIDKVLTWIERARIKGVIRYPVPS